MDNYITVAVPKFPQDELSECGAASGSLVWKFRVNDFYDWLKVRWMSRLWWPWATGAEVEVGGGGDLMLKTVYQLSVCAPASELLSSLWFVGLFWLKWLALPGWSLNPPGPRKNLHLIARSAKLGENPLFSGNSANMVADTIGSSEQRQDGGRCGSLLRQIEWPSVESAWCLRKQNHNPVHARHSSWRQHFEPSGPPQLSVELSYRKLSKLKVHPWSWY